MKKILLIIFVVFFIAGLAYAAKLYTDNKEAEELAREQAIERKVEREKAREYEKMVVLLVEELEEKSKQLTVDRAESIYDEVKNFDVPKDMTQFNNQLASYYKNMALWEVAVNKQQKALNEVLDSSDYVLEYDPDFDNMTDEEAIEAIEEIERRVDAMDKKYEEYNEHEDELTVEIYEIFKLNNYIESSITYLEKEYKTFDDQYSFDDEFYLVTPNYPQEVLDIYKF